MPGLPVVSLVRASGSPEVIWSAGGRLGTEPVGLLQGPLRLGPKLLEPGCFCRWWLAEVVGGRALLLSGELAEH